MKLTALLAGLTFVAALAPAAARGESAALPPPVAQALQAAKIPAGSVGLYVRELAAAAPRLRFNADAAFNPASVEKLLTTYAALELLGSAYTWRTEAYAAGPLDKGVLRGDLHLKGSGDPKLGFERLWLLLRELRAKGVREIRGDLVLDRSRFAPLAHDPAAFDGKPLRAYNVGPDALLLNFNTLRFDFAPGEDGSVALLHEPRPAGLRLRNEIRLAQGACGDWKEALAVEAAAGQVRLDGRYAAGCGEKSWNLAVLGHQAYFDGVFRELWAELGGRLTGKTREGAVPAEARLLAHSESPPLADVVRDINKWSNNVMARQLFLTLGAEHSGRPASAADAEAALRAWLAAKGLDFPELVIDNGAGLSRKARVSAASLGRLLEAAFASAVMPEFMASLSLVAVDGTLRKRLRDNGAAGQAHLKTGYLEGVRALAGYVLDRRGRRWAIALLINDANAGAAQPVQDALVEWVYAQAP